MSVSEADSVAVGNGAISAADSISVGASAFSSLNSIAIGETATASNGIAIGRSTYADNGIAVGNNGAANKAGSVSIGYNSKVDGKYANLFGSNCFNYNPSTTVIGSVVLGDRSDVLKRTQLYLIPEGSELANQCYPNAVNGHNACLGFAVFDSDNNIIQKGTRKLSDLLIDNTQSSDPFKPSTIPSNN